MVPMSRQPEPAFWAMKENGFKAGTLAAADALHGWRHKKRSLAEWFHAMVRRSDEPQSCAYCDVLLREGSRATIDHFIPEYACRELGLAWLNLYPACDNCNSTQKQTRWNCQLVRPDIHPVEDWFVFSPFDGRLRCGVADKKIRLRVRLTIIVLGLNTPERCQARLRTWRDLRNAIKHPKDDAALKDYAASGPYRIVARTFIKTIDG